MDNSSTPRNPYLQAGGLFSLVFAVFQVSAIFWSQELLKYFGGPVTMQAEKPFLYVVLCVVIGAIVAVCGLYALSGAGKVRRLPFLRTMLISITAVFILRGLELVLDVKLIREHPDLELTRFAFFSLIALCVGIIHLLGVVRFYRRGPVEEG